MSSNSPKRRRKKSVAKRVLRFIIVPSDPHLKSDGHTRRTTIANTEQNSQFHVIGGDEDLHSKNTALAQKLAQLPNNKQFSAEARRLLASNE